MLESPPVTVREAVLASLLLHSLLFIVMLLFPGVFTWHPTRSGAPRDDETIAVAFLREAPPDRPEVVLGDAGEVRRSDPRDAAAPPRNADPFSRGNTPNRFLAPPAARPPSPEPGQPRQDAGSQAPPAPGVEQEAAGAAAQQEPATGEPAVEEAREGWRVPPGRGEIQKGGGAAGTRAPGSIKEALGRMSVGHGGAGDPLRYDNPVGGLSGPTGGLSFDTPGFDWGPYARRIYWIIWTNWTRGWPPAARAGLSGVVTVRFRIHRDGTISSITVMQESGTPAFDTCATLALEASSPLPPLPGDFPKDSEGITARFLYNVEDASAGRSSP